jgi:urea carboxylase
MEGPGGYQFVGRTCQVWNTYKVTEAFAKGRPWLLRFFDQIRFYSVSPQELLDFRADFLHGRAHVRTHESTFCLRDYRRFLADNRDSIAAHKARQQSAFEAERARWQASEQRGSVADLPDEPEAPRPEAVPADCVAVASPVAGSVWRIRAAQGQRVKAGDTLVLIESMKMEVAVTAPTDGRVSELRCVEGRAVSFAQTLVILQMSERREVA